VWLLYSRICFKYFLAYYSKDFHSNPRKFSRCHKYTYVLSTFFVYGCLRIQSLYVHRGKNHDLKKWWFLKVSSVIGCYFCFKSIRSQFLGIVDRQLILLCKSLNHIYDIQKLNMSGWSPYLKWEIQDPRFGRISQDAS